MQKDMAYMNEDETRRYLDEIITKVSENRYLGMETRTATDTLSVQYHLRIIFRAGGGLWNEMIAKQYVCNLEAEIGQDTAALKPAYC